MITSFVAILALLPIATLAQNTTDTHSDDRTSGLTDFVRTGYPIIACVTGGLLFLYALLHAARHIKNERNATAGTDAHRRSGWMRHPLWNIMNLLLALFGIFLIFGPDNFSSTYDNGTPFNSPRAAIIGLQLLIQAALGVYASTAAERHASLAFALFGIFNFLCLAGSNLLFNYNQPIWHLSETQCNRYFGSYDITRCNDTGFLQVLRAMGTLALFSEGFLIVASLISYFAGHKLVTGLTQQGHPIGYGAPYATSTTVSEKYPAGYPTGTTAGYPSGTGAGYPAGTAATSSTGYRTGPGYAPGATSTTQTTRVHDEGDYRHHPTEAHHTTTHV